MSNEVMPAHLGPYIKSQFPQGVVAVDLETTGLSPIADKIIEISAYKIMPNGDVEIFDQLINPEIEIPRHTIDIHGIENKMVQDSPKLDSVLPQFLEFTGKLPIIAHNAKFDLGFLIFNAHRLSLSFDKNKIYDSCHFLRTIYKKNTFKKKPKNFKLGTLTEFFAVPLLNHHRALDDAKACLHIFAHGVKVIKERDFQTTVDKLALTFNTDDYKDLSQFSMPKQLEGIKEITASQEIIEILYKGGTKKDQFRPIRPISLLPTTNGIVLYSHCIRSNLLKSFSLKKIKEIKRLPIEEQEALKKKIVEQNKFTTQPKDDKKDS